MDFFGNHWKVFLVTSVDLLYVLKKMSVGSLSPDKKTPHSADT